MAPEPEVVAILKRELRKTPPAQALRAVAEHFGLNKTDLAWAMTDAVTEVLTPDVQAIWLWDLGRTGKGHSDAELDKLLEHLRPLES